MVAAVGYNGHPYELERARVAREIFGARYRAGQTVQLREIAAELKLDDQSVLKAFAEFQALGMVTLSGNFSATVQSQSPKEMKEAYEIRATLEEIAGRSAATALRSKTAELQNELDAMRAAVREGDLETYAEHNVNFHKIILKAAQNEVLQRVWDTLTIDLRMRAANRRVSQYLPDLVESHQPIVDALEKGHGREAAVLLRNHVETCLEYLRKSESDSGLNRRIQNDLEGAKEVQEALFPAPSLSIPCISCETFYQPVRGIGGDYYDLLPLQGGRWGIAIGDVSGKGIGAALIMASLQASLRAQASHPHFDLSVLIGDVNRLVHESTPAHFFATLFYAEYKPATRTLKYVNAGHISPVVVRPRNGSCEIFRLDSASMPVGLSADPQFVSTTFRFEIGDVLVAYTDGITEAQRRDGEHWGQQRLEKLLESCSRETPDRIITSILDELSAFANGQSQQDDVTLVVMGVQEGCDV
jgi:serine phosphatase RsbU (regulator of sigma subunit)/DNA-binding transcriptional regulator YhcF (GntR family)